MTGFQRLMTKILPAKWAQDMEAESRSWILHCPNCNFEQSLWDAGGIRWKAHSNKTALFRCPNCGKTSMHTMERRMPA
jgi:predicted RNA-binding Zn-ribbon protein involved in translation (DUF1610 family)